MQFRNGISNKRVAKFGRLTFKYSKWKKSRLISSQNKIDKYNVILRGFLPHITAVLCISRSMH